MDGDVVQTIESGGRTRQYILHIPPSYDASGGTQAVPLVLNLHGHSDDAERQASYSRLPGKADEAGFILVSPDGTETPRDPGRHWVYTLLDRLIDPEAPDDLAFFGALLDDLESQLCIDPVRIFVTGMSNGAFMTSRLACNLSDRIAAFAPVAGVYFPPWSTTLQFEPACGTKPSPVIAFHGDADTNVPFVGGPLNGNYTFQLRHIENAVIPDWAAHNGCDTEPARERVAEHVRLVRYEDCDRGATVELYVVEGGGHAWPGGECRQDLGCPTQEISANDLMWEFFAAHPLVDASASPTVQPAATSGPVALPSTGTGGDREASLGWLIAAIAASVALAGTAWWARRSLARR